MVSRRVLSNLGIYAYGLGAIALGVTGLVWGDFATTWQRVGENVHYHHALASLAAFCELFGGVAILWRRTAGTGAAMLTILYSIFTLLWVPPIIATPQVYDGWGNFFEELSLVIAGAVVYAWSAPSDSVWASRRAQISRVYGICVISYGLDHLFYIKGAATWVPRWIPPGQVFWIIATAICFLLAAFAILSGIQMGLASRLLTAMIVSFEALVWAPKLFATPHAHFMWAGNAVCVALVGAAWVVSDALSEPRQTTLKPTSSQLRGHRLEPRIPAVLEKSKENV